MACTMVPNAVQEPFPAWPGLRSMRMSSARFALPPRAIAAIFPVPDFERNESRTMSDKNTIRALYVGWALGLVLLPLAVSGKHPYGFYILLRWIACAVFAYSAFAAHRLERPLWTWLFAVEAMLFNPFVRIHFQRETWQTLDWLAIASVIVAAAMFRKELRA
jgi:hypothetical protein